MAFRCGFHFSILSSMKRALLITASIAGAVAVVLFSARNRPLDRLTLRELTSWEAEAKRSPQGLRRWALAAGALAHSCGTLRRAIQLGERLQREVPGYATQPDVSENLRQLREKYRLRLNSRGFPSDAAFIAWMSQAAQHIPRTDPALQLARAEVALAMGKPGVALRELIAEQGPACLTRAQAYGDQMRFRDAIRELHRAQQVSSRQWSQDMARLYDDRLAAHGLGPLPDALRAQILAVQLGAIGQQAATFSALDRITSTTRTKQLD